MKIINKTRWRTDHLKAILQKAAEIELEPAKRKVLRVEVSYTRGAQSSGCAYIGGRTATVRIRHPESRRTRWVPYTDDTGVKRHKRDTSPLPLTLDGQKELVLHFASVAAHEFAHIRGATHAVMSAKYKWSGNWREYVEWAANMPLDVQVPKAKVTPTVDAKLDHVRKMLKLAETRQKRATTIVKKWRTKERYYERAMAAREAKTT